MPAVNHAELALDGPSSTAHSDHQFSQTHICAGLIVLTVLVTLLSLAFRLFRPRADKGEEKYTAQRHRKAVDDLSHLVNQQRLHHLFFQTGVWNMEGKSRVVSSNFPTAGDRSNGKTGPQPDLLVGNEKETEATRELEKSEQLHSTGNMFGPGNLADLSSTSFLPSRPAPPPPLTPPELSPSVHTYEDRRMSLTGVASELDASFFQQPNPDYTSSSSSSEAAITTATQSTQSTRSSPTPRRRSYTKTLPIGVPASAPGLAPGEAGVVPSPSSYPPTNMLPGPPPIHGEILEDGTFRKIEVHGEIISVLDGNGTGWKRHTRVYGGGVCLACAASGNDGHHGGFYGENVLPEEKRY